MKPIANCHDCGVGLESIVYLMPSTSLNIKEGGIMEPYDPKHRPPLCKECWQKRIKTTVLETGRAIRSADQKPPENIFLNKV